MQTLSECTSLLRDYMRDNATRYGITRMGIFGSVARNEQTEASDVDVYIEGQLHGFFALAGIKQDLEELLKCKVDIVRLRNKMDAYLRKRILEEGVYV
jgi:predicted nucleotidyltransferase